MSDSPSDQHEKPDYEGFDPDLSGSREDSKRRINVSTVQVGASAAAAVTSALAASFFGVAGTLIGAAVGSIISTVAGALYADYLKRAGMRLRDSRSVVIQRLPADVLASTALRHLTGPADLPVRESMQPIGEQSGDETVAVPVEPATELLAKPDPGKTALFEQPDQTQQQPEVHVLPPARWWKRSALMLAAVGAGGFLIALGVVSTIELVNGGPVSGGNGGTSLSTVVLDTSDTPESTPTPVVTSTPQAPSETADDEPSATATGAPKLPVAPDVTATEPSATDLAQSTPTTDPSAPSVAPTEG